MTPTLYGIKACDTMVKARAWLASKGIDYRFHDYKTQGLEADRLAGWVDQVGWELLLNRQGTTFRKLDADQKADLDRLRAISLMLAQTSMVKRPVLEIGDAIHVGFKPETWQAIFF